MSAIFISLLILSNKISALYLLAHIETHSLLEYNLSIPYSLPFLKSLNQTTEITIHSIIELFCLGKTFKIIKSKC